MNSAYERHMQYCIDLAEIALSNGEAPVGATLVFENKIIGEGIECVKSADDVTGHAEILAIKDAIKKGNKNILGQSVLFTTHEPCIMCSYVIRNYKIPEIVFGMPVPLVGGLSSPFKVLLTEQVTRWGPAPRVIQNVSEQKCSSLSDRFLSKNK